MATRIPDQHIEVTPGVAGGKPRIVGRRIKVQDIVVWHERLGKGVEEMAAEHDLSLSDIHAALAYCFDHQTEIDQAIDESQAFVEELRQQTPSKLWQGSPAPPH